MHRVIVRGVGDVGSAVAHRLFTAGYRIIIHDGPLPTTSRRLNAFADAVFDGRAHLAGVTAVRVDDLGTLPECLAGHECVPVVVGDFATLLAVADADVLIDARMRKRVRPEPQRGLAPYTIGLGPNFIAGETVDVAVETSWEDLGGVITSGPTRPLQGEPRAILGHERDRFIYAPVAGVFRTTRRIGDAVRAGEVVASVGAIPLAAPLAGALRGLTHDGVPVERGTKIIEVDPRGPSGVVAGIGERPGRITDGVLAALRRFPAFRHACD